MVRRWVVERNPETGVVDRQAVIEALMDGEAMVHRAGGTLTMVVHRAPVERPVPVPGEMATVAAVFEWKDRTGDARPQPEVAVAPPAVAEPEPEPPLADEVLAEIDDQAELDMSPVAESDRVVLDEDGELEDVSAIPLALR